ncbi:hypothetical protein SAMN05446037_1006121 [Anaerovirgula multivorans]|uniref:Uncharacterized protein n=1 Tax=Anaerovirgula multivorans TaxID=312168 RepID=A0A239CU50_9FIRM|nr:hypothetical protein [Anaerovirgula multivorans]SNS22883.1 hypothetical protein SAMN05446037_1006121 [Anaerovirgula multivorans]
MGLELKRSIVISAVAAHTRLPLIYVTGLFDSLVVGGAISSNTSIYDTTSILMESV